MVGLVNTRILVGLVLTLLSPFAHAGDREKLIAQQLTSVFENSTTRLRFTFVENIHDGRGYTFGFPGFCSGTYDGTMFLKAYRRLNPNNRLVQFIPAFEAIDRGRHDDEGRNPSTEGLNGFPRAFRSCGRDPDFRRAQVKLVDQLYWSPSQAIGNKIGAKLPITRGQLYDACINHGEDGALDMIKTTNRAVGGTPKSGVDEELWLAKFLDVRFKVLNSDPTWKQAVDRVRVYRKFLEEGNVRLKPPLRFACYGDSFTIR